MKNKQILFISYDGLCDQLGQSQILPYLAELKKKYEIYILSFEKKINISDEKINYINKNFNWTFKIFTESKYKIFKLLDYIKLFFYSLSLIRRYNIKICHGRGFLPSLIIYLIKNLINIKLIFDVRGFWPDERIDNNQLNKNNKIDKIIYKLLKYLEIKILYSSDHVVVLTQKAKNILLQYNKKITVIPCATNFSMFSNSTFNDNDLIKNNIQFNINKYKIFCYLGSVDGAYMYDEVLRYFKLIKIKYKNVMLITITKNNIYANNILSHNKYKTIKNNVKIFSLERKELPFYLNICYAMISFVKNSYARKAMSPVKISEALAANLPIIINQNIGDIDEHLIKFDIGFSININDIKSIKNSISKINNLSNKQYHRDKAFKIYDISTAIKKYSDLYYQL